jgi:hypothetical protein
MYELGKIVLCLAPCSGQSITGMLQKKPARVSTLRIRRIPSADDANPTIYKRYPKVRCRIIEKENIHFLSFLLVRMYATSNVTSRPFHIQSTVPQDWTRLIRARIRVGSVDALTYERPNGEPVIATCLGAKEIGNH